MKNFSFKTKRNSHQNSEAKRILVQGVLYIAIALFAVFFLKNILSGFMSSSVTLFMHVREYFRESSATFPSYLRSHSELQDEIDRLNETIASQSGNSATVARLMSENEELRGLLGETSDERILGGVIARPPGTPYDVLVVDRGSNHDVREGAVVYHSGDHALGMVTRVYPTVSLVTLFSTPDVESTVYLYGPDVFAYAYGEGGGVIRISLPQGIQINEGDPVVLPSLHMGDLGVVERVVSVPTQPEQSAYLTFPRAIQSIRTVTISKEPMSVPDVSTLEANVAFLESFIKVEVPDAVRFEATTTASTTAPGSL